MSAHGTRAAVTMQQLCCERRQRPNAYTAQTCCATTRSFICQPNLIMAAAEASCVLAGRARAHGRRPLRDNDGDSDSDDEFGAKQPNSSSLQRARTRRNANVAGTRVPSALRKFDAGKRDLQQWQHDDWSAWRESASLLSGVARSQLRNHNRATEIIVINVMVNH